MRMSRMFSKTLREAPNGADTKGYEYLLRAGYIRQMGASVLLLHDSSNPACGGNTYRGSTPYLEVLYRSPYLLRSTEFPVFRLAWQERLIKYDDRPAVIRKPHSLKIECIPHTAMIHQRGFYADRVRLPSLPPIHIMTG